MKRTSKIYLLVISWIAATQILSAQPWSERMAATLMVTHADSFCYDKTRPAKWDYELGLFMESIEQVWRNTGDGKYLRYIRKQTDNYIREDGTIRTYDLQAFNIDHITPGRPVLLLWQLTGQEKYRKAAQLLRQQLAEQPRTREGGFWHKKRYPWQMWLDGLYMGEPYYAEYSVLFSEPQNFDDIANQLIWMEKNSRDAKTGLLYHAYDESREQKWADKTNGHAPNFWGRAMGWYAMALVDVLDYFPKTHPKHGEIVAILQRLAVAITQVQDANTGVWYQVLDKATEPGNYREASASCMFTYALLKGVRLGYLDAKYLETGKKAYAGLLKEFMVQDADGSWHLDKVCMVAGLGGDPYRDGSFQYYVSEPIRRDDLKGAGPFIQASIEMERLPEAKLGAGKTVLLDHYFNNEYRDGAPFHYTWEDVKDSGFLWWGDIFRGFGATTAALDQAPTAANLKNAQTYILVDPDTRKETAQPHFIEKQHIAALEQWVKEGGTLVLLANDTANCEIPHFNELAAQFGIRFTDRSRNMVKNNQFEQGSVTVPPGHPIFKTSHKLYIKELSVLALKPPAKATITEGSDIIMATAQYGKGRVFALGDPWLYNEYVDGHKLPADYDNFNAARDLARWLLAPPATPKAWSGESRKVAEAVETMRKAMVSGDRKALETITDDALSYGHSDGKVESKASFVEKIASGRSDFVTIDLTDQSIVVSGKTAIVRHRLSAATNDAGKGPGSIHLAILLVWEKQKSGWKLLARQAVKI